MMARGSNMFLFFTLMVGLLSAPVMADIKRGKTLHDTNCTQCHAALVGGDGSGIYTREDRRVDDLDMLKQQVRRCRDSLGFPWPDDQIADVVEYLNQNYYHFTPDKATH